MVQKSSENASSPHKKGHKTVFRQLRMVVEAHACMVTTYSSKSKDQPGKVANLVRGQLNRETNIPCPRSRLRVWSRETGSAVPSRISLVISILRLHLMLTGFLPMASIYLFKPPYAIESVPSLSGHHAFAY